MKRLWRAWILLAAYGPSLLYVGHLSFEVPLPGTGLSIGLAAAHSHSGAGDEARHRDHCHVDVSDCSGIPSTTAVPVALLREQAEALVAATTVPVAIATPGALVEQVRIAPEGPPPRTPVFPRPA